MKSKLKGQEVSEIVSKSSFRYICIDLFVIVSMKVLLGECESFSFVPIHFKTRKLLKVAKWPLSVFPLLFCRLRKNATIV